MITLNKKIPFSTTLYPQEIPLLFSQLNDSFQLEMEEEIVSTTSRYRQVAQTMGLPEVEFRCSPLSRAEDARILTNNIILLPFEAFIPSFIKKHGTFVSKTKREFIRKLTPAAHDFRIAHECAHILFQDLQKLPFVRKALHLFLGLSTPLVLYKISNSILICSLLTPPIFLLLKSLNFHRFFENRWSIFMEERADRIACLRGYARGAIDCFSLKLRFCPQKTSFSFVHRIFRNWLMTHPSTESRLLKAQRYFLHETTS